MHSGHHHSHHHRQPAPLPDQPVKHHYGSGRNTGKVLVILAVCLIVNLFWYYTGASHP